MRDDIRARAVGPHLVAPRAARRVEPVLVGAALGPDTVTPVPIVVRRRVCPPVAMPARPRPGAVAATARVLVVPIPVVVIVVVMLVILLPPACPDAIAIARAMVARHRRLGSLVASCGAVGQVGAGLCEDRQKSRSSRLFS
jgi:hypothetical protein